MDGSENQLRRIGFHISFSWRVWNRHREDLADLVSRYPKIFGHMKRGPFWSGFVNHYFEPVIPEDFDAEPEDMKPGQKRDEWGILWGTSEGGVGRHPFDSEAPLADWKVLDTYQPPDPADYRDRHGRNWDEIEKHFGTLKEKGQRTRGDGGELFTRLYYLRGFNNLMIDIGTDDPGLLRLLDMVKAYEDEMVRRWMSIGVDSMYFHTDIGMQDRLMISPEKFRQWIKPWFKKIFLPVITSFRVASIHEQHLYKRTTGAFFLPFLVDLGRLSESLQFFRLGICHHVFFYSGCHIINKRPSKYTHF